MYNACEGEYTNVNSSKGRTDGEENKPAHTHPRHRNGWWVVDPSRERKVKKKKGPKGKKCRVGGPKKENGENGGAKHFVTGSL
jgi:hypothetical protein